MKKTHYKKVVLEGFQSAAKQIVLPLDMVGLNLVKGDNGLGKSTMFNAILWAEYGINLKKSIETWADKQPSGYRGTRVVVDRTDGTYDYRVARHLNFKGTTCGLTGGSKLMIFKKPIDEKSFGKEHLVGDGLHKSDMEAIIQSQIGMDGKTFQNSILFGQRMKGLITMDNKDKRKLFEELFDVAFVDDAKEKAKEQKTKLESEINSLTVEFNNADDSLADDLELLKEQKEILANFDKEKKERIAFVESKQKKITADILQADSDLSEVSKELSKIDDSNLVTAKKHLEEVTAKIKDAGEVSVLSSKISGYAAEIEKANRNIDKYKHEIETVDENCSYCGQSLQGTEVSPAEIKKKIQANIKKELETIEALAKKKLEAEKSKNKVEKTLVKLHKEKEEVQDTIASFKDITEKSAELKAKKRYLAHKIDEFKSDLHSVNSDLKKEKSKEKPKVSIDATESRIKANKEVLSNNGNLLSEKGELLDRVTWWITKGFSSSGLKAFVFNAMLSQLNIFCHKYASRLGLSVKFSIDMTKASKPFQTIVYKDGLPRFYEDFSGGQAQRIDLCIAFAMHDLVSMGSDINVLVMDEAFEGLDNAGIETAFEFLRQKAEDKSVFLITHSPLIDSLNSRSIWVGLDEDGNTYVK